MEEKHELSKLESGEEKNSVKCEEEKKNEFNSVCFTLALVQFALAYTAVISISKAYIELKLIALRC